MIHTHLAKSARLPLEDPEHVYWPPPQTGILSLSNEILLQIFGEISGYSAEWDDRSADANRSSVAVSCVCRRFNSLMTPLLYRRLELGPDRSRGSKRAAHQGTGLLHRTLKEDPSLRRYCRSLRMCLGYDVDGTTTDSLMELVGWLTGTKELRVRGELRDNTWGLISKAVRQMPALRTMSLSGQWFLDLRRVCQILGELPSLRDLTLSGVMTMPSLASWNSFKERTSHITSLTLLEFNDSPEDLARLLTWPAALESFSFSWVSQSEYYGIWSVALVARLLSPHRSTLRRLVVGEMGQKGLTGLDLAGFSSLEYLGLSAWTTGFMTGQEAILLAPRLASFCWSFAVEGLGRESLADFNEAAETWLRRLASMAAARRSRLQEVSIQYAPGAGPSEEAQARLFLQSYQMTGWEKKRASIHAQSVYPWDRMEAIRGDMGNQGIRLSWPAPTIDREEFDRLRDSRPDQASSELGVYVMGWEQECGGSSDARSLPRDMNPISDSLPVL